MVEDLQENCYTLFPKYAKNIYLFVSLLLF